MQFGLRTLNPDLNPNMYQQALKVLEDSTEYWLPVQEPLRTDFVEELAAGDTITIFVVYAGVYTLAADSTKARRMFGITEFESSRPDRQWFSRDCPNR